MHRAMTCLLLLAAAGCAHTSAPATVILVSNGKSAHYSLREIVWRANPDGVELIGYGLIPYYNSPLSQDYDGTDDRSGFDTFWLHCVPGSSGRYAVAMTLPNRGWGYRPDELLRGEFEGAAAPGENDTQVLEFRDVPVNSRNHPEAKVTMSAMIVAKPTDDAGFERKLHRFEIESAAYRNDK